MRYMLLIYANEEQAATAMREQGAPMSAAYFAFGEQYKDKIQSGDALLPTSASTTVRVRDAKTLTTDGPFAETKEQLAGFYIVTCENLDEAIEIASHIPGAAIGTVEVRPVREFNS